MHRFLAIVLAVAAASAQSPMRPVPPPGGHPTAIDLAVPVTYSDGYQTFGTLLRPAGPAPAGGWPLVVHVHPLGQSQGYQFDLQSLIAGQGYAVWSYDVRGQGLAYAANTAHPNRGTTLWGPVERCDLVEQIQFVAANPTWSGIVDAGRIAIVGVSQGGAHAWSAAAWSGQSFAVPGRPTATMPTIACVAPSDFVADTCDDWVRHGMLFSTWWVEAIDSSVPGLELDAAWLQTCRSAFVAQDAAGLQAGFVAEGRPLGARLAQSSVPVFYAHAYHDLVDHPLTAVRQLEAMTAPRRALLGAVGHDVPDNDGEREFRRVLTLRWLHRWLWQETNEVEAEPRFILAELPLDGVVHDDPQSLWSRVGVDSVATPSTAPRQWLHDDGALRLAAPTAPQADAAVQQTIDPQATQFTPAQYLTQPAVRALPAVLAACPLSERVYTLTTATETELAASATLHARLVPQSPRWLLAASLTVQPPQPGAPEVLLTADALASDQSVPGVAETRTLRLPPVAARIPAGAIVRLRLRNLWLRENPMQPRLEVAPLFHDFRVDVVHGDVAGSWLDLPLQPVAPKLVVDRQWLDVASPTPIHARLRAGAARAGLPYFAAVSLSGQTPGAAYLNAIIPLDVDWLTIESVAATAPPFAGMLGFLDAAGEASLGLDLSGVPLPQGLNGYRFTFAAFVWDGPWAPTGAASNAAEVQLR